MMYQFSGKKLVVLLVSATVLGFLTFAAGVVTGIGMAMPSREQLALLTAKPATPAAEAAPHLPALSPTAALAAAKALPAAAVGQAKTDATAAVAGQTAPAAGAPAAAPSAAAAPETAAAAAPAPPPSVVARHTSAADAEDSVNAFSLQIGSFRDLNNAKQLQTELKDRGYSSSILTALDSDQREWHVVRIDGYKSLASASQAAADFIGKERIPALVRRSKTL